MKPFEIGLGQIMGSNVHQFAGHMDPPPPPPAAAAAAGARRGAGGGVEGRRGVQTSPALPRLNLDDSYLYQLQRGGGR